MSQIALLAAHKGTAFLHVTPGRALSDKKLSDAAFRTLAALVSFQDAEGIAWPSLKVLAERRGAGESTVRRHIEELRTLGYIETKRRRRDDGTMSGLIFRTIFSPPLAGLVNATLPKGEWADDDHRSEVSGGTTAQEVSTTTAQEVSTTTAQEVSAQEPCKGTIQENHSGAAKRRARIKADWQPTRQGRDWAEACGVSVDLEIDQFRDYHMAHGTLSADWTLNWRTWVRKAVQFSTPKGRKPEIPSWTNFAPASSAAGPKRPDPRVSARLARMQDLMERGRLNLPARLSWIGTPAARDMTAERMIADLDEWLAEAARRNGLKLPPLPGEQLPLAAE